MAKKPSKRNSIRKQVLLASAPLFVAALMMGNLSPAKAQSNRPALEITNDPLPADLKKKLYLRPSQTPTIDADDVTGRSYFTETETIVSRKVDELNGELRKLQNKVGDISSTLTSLERDSEKLSVEYYSNLATINTQLQNGTTPGNPRLVKKVKAAENQLEDLSGNISRLNQLAVDTAHIATEASFLLEATRAAYGLSGAVEEDHIQLAKTEDAINNTIVAIERVMNTMNDDLTRTTAYLSSERNNLRTLSLAVANGDLYGKSLTSRPFSSASQYTPASYSPQRQSNAAAAPAPSVTPMPAEQAPEQRLANARPLVKIRFDSPDVEYEQAVYTAVNEALDRYPNAAFELVAINPTKGNAAQVAIESTRARRNAERVLRTLTQMGLPLDRVDLSYMDNADIQTNEVHLYIR